MFFFFFFQAEDGIRYLYVTGVQTCALPIWMADVARSHGIEVEIGGFESWDARERRFDLIVSGQAWHWIDPDVGAAKAASLLRPGGLLVPFWNFSVLDPDVSRRVDAAYERVEAQLAGS